MTFVGNVLETVDYVTGSAISSPAAETAILSTDPIQVSIPSDLPQPGGVAAGAAPVAYQVVRPVKILVNINITPGTAATALVINVRQGVGVGGALVAQRTVACTAGALLQIYLVFRDSSGVPFTIAGTAYTVTIAETSATGAGTVNSIDVEVQQ